MSKKTKQEPTITFAKGGTAQKIVPLSQVQIPDLWHLAQNEMDLGARAAILTTWHIAHDLLRELRELHERNKRNER